MFPHPDHPHDSVALIEPPMPSINPNYPPRVKTTFASLYGAMMIASVVNFFFYGIALYMVLRYLKRHASRDPLTLKATICALGFLATLETFFFSYQIYDVFITKLGNTTLLDEIVFSVTGKYVCIYFTAFIAQLFFCSRIWTVGSSLRTRLRYLAFPAIWLAFTQIAAGLAWTGLTGTNKSFSKLTMRAGFVTRATVTQGIAAALCDVVISAALCLILDTHRSGLKRTNLMVNQLIAYAIHRAIATSLCAVLSVLLFILANGSFYFMIPLAANTHVYVICVVSVLTSREGHRKQSEVEATFHLTDLGLSTTQSEVLSHFDLETDSQLGTTAANRDA